MEKMTFTQIARKLDVSPQYVSQIIRNIQRPNWKRAKQLAAITRTSPELWLEGTPDQIRAAIARKPDTADSEAAADQEAVNF
jgi:transcriptional regulator with XRE-family HTH domain